MNIFDLFKKKETPPSAVLKSVEGMPIHLNLDYGSKEGLRRVVSRLINLHRALLQKGHSTETRKGYAASIMKKEAILLLNDLEIPKTLEGLETLREELS